MRLKMDEFNKKLDEMRTEIAHMKNEKKKNAKMKL